MNPLGTRSRAEELARLLDGNRTAAPTAGGAVALAGRLQLLGASAPAPRPEFRAALRTRLVAVASVQAANAAAPVRKRPLETAVSWSQSRRTQRGFGLAAGAMASVVAVAGVAVAGSQSLPGDPFYGVKRGSEALELRTTSGDVAKGSKHLEFAAERLKEVRELTLGRDAALGLTPDHPMAAGVAFGGSLTTRLRDTLADMDDETQSGSSLLTSAYRDSRQEAPLEILSRFANRQTAALTALLPSLPAGARTQAASSLALVSDVALETSQLLAVGVCTGACAPSGTAPVLPPSNGGPVPQPASGTSDAPCGCQPGPAPVRTADPAASGEPVTSPEPQPTAAPSPTPTPSPTRTSDPGPLPTPLPTLPSPLPTLPVPIPTLSPLVVPTLSTGGLLPGVSILPSAPSVG